MLVKHELDDRYEGEVSASNRACLSSPLNFLRLLLVLIDHMTR